MKCVCSTNQELHVYCVQMSRKENDLWWIGLHSFKNDGRLRWSDHSVLNYVSWGLGQPRPISKEPKCAQISASKGLVTFTHTYRIRKYVISTLNLTCTGFDCTF